VSTSKTVPQLLALIRRFSKADRPKSMALSLCRPSRAINHPCGFLGERSTGSTQQLDAARST